jgi:hypothetical protein
MLHKRSLTVNVLRADVQQEWRKTPALWLKRPLTHAMLTFAALNVQSLVPLSAALLAERFAPTTELLASASNAHVFWFAQVGKPSGTCARHHV